MRAISAQLPFTSLQDLMCCRDVYGVALPYCSKIVVEIVLRRTPARGGELFRLVESAHGYVA
jgi:hypothetical protein